MDFPLRVLVLGCGSIGRRHIENLIALNVGEILAFDVLESQRHAAHSDFGIGIANSLEEVWDFHPQIALVTASTQTHIPLALQAARHNYHIFIEKPLSHSLEGLDELVAEVERRGLITMVGCNMRFHPGPAMVKHLLDEKTIGQVIAARIQAGSYLPCWHPQQDYRQSYSASLKWGGAILDCIHEIDLAVWYLGPAQVVSAARLPAHTIGLETDGLAEITLRHTSGVISNVHLNFIQRDYRRTCQIIGSEGSIYWDFNEHQVRVFGSEGELTSIYPEPEGWQLNKMYLAELEHFVQAVRISSPTENPISGGSAVLKIALEARQMKGA